MSSKRFDPKEVITDNKYQVKVLVLVSQKFEKIGNLCKTKQLNEYRICN